MLRFVLIILLLDITGTCASAFDKFQFYLVRSIKEVSAELLRGHGLVSVKDDNSIIVPDIFTDDNSTSPSLFRPKNAKWYHFQFLTKFHYTQTKLSSQVPDVSFSKSIPVQGCVDNRYSETITTISRTYSRTLLFENGPHMFMSVLGMEAGMLLHLGYYNTRDEKLQCNVNPGQILQLQARVATMSIMVELHRNILVIRKFLSRDRIEFSDWYPSKLLTPLSFQSTTLSCVTNTTLLRC